MARKGYDPLAGRTFWNVTQKARTDTREVWDGYGYVKRASRTMQNVNVPAASLKEATLVASLLKNGRHAPALDLDFRAAIRTGPSGTTYLLLDRKAAPSKVEAFMDALGAAGIIRPSSASLENASSKAGPIPFPPLELTAPAKLLPSSTPGHYHLYVAKELDWKAYRVLLDKAMFADVISGKYYSMSLKAKMTMLLKPGLTKTKLAAEAEARKKAAVKKRQAAAKKRKQRRQATERSSRSLRPRWAYPYWLDS